MNFESLVGPAYTPFSQKAEAQRSVNVYRERVQSGQGVNAFALYKSPGLTVVGSLPPVNAVGPVRGMMEQNGHVFTVTAGRIDDFDSDGIVASYGTIANNGLPVQMAASPNSLLIVSVGTLYRINAGVLSTISLPFTPIGIVFIKNYFVALSSTLQQFYWSTDDGAAFPAANVQTAEADNNNLLAIAVLHQQLWVIGNRVTQVFYVGDNPNGPFVPNDSAVIRSGTVAANSVRSLGDSLFWLERNKDGQNKVVMTQGYAAVRVSNHALENVIRGYARDSTIEDAVGTSFEMNGHEFYRLTFPTADRTWEYNRTADDWEETLWWDWRNGVFHRHRAMTIVSAFSKILAGDHSNGRVYEMSPDVYHDFGFPQLWIRRTPHVVEENKRVAYSRLELGVETGVGLGTPLWLNDYSFQKGAFDTEIATLLAATTITVQQSLVMTLIYDNRPYDTSVVMPSASVMNSVGFYEWGRDPQIALRYSNDGGKSYGMDLNRSLGRLGFDNLRVYWDRLGSARDRVFELTGSDPCKLAITTGWLEAELAS